MYLPLIAAFIAISGSMGVSYMASDSLPGDVLYSVKVHINEEMRHIAALSPEADAKVSLDIIASRADEARRLVAEGRLDSEAKNSISQELQSELNTWKKVTENWAASGTSSSQTEARTTFESQAKENADIFGLLNVSLDQPVSATTGTGSSTAESQPELPLLEANAASTTETSSSDVTNDNASTSLNAGGVINVN